MRNTPISSLGFSLFFIHQFSLFSHRYSCYYCFSILHYFLYFLYFLVKTSQGTFYKAFLTTLERNQARKTDPVPSTVSLHFKKKKNLFPNPQESNIATVPIAYTLSVLRFVSRYTVCYHPSLATPFSILPSPSWQHTAAALFAVYATAPFPHCPRDSMETRKKKKKKKEKRKKKRQ